MARRLAARTEETEPLVLREKSDIGGADRAGLIVAFHAGSKFGTALCHQTVSARIIEVAASGVPVDPYW